MSVNPNISGTIDNWPCKSSRMRGNDVGEISKAGPSNAISSTTRVFRFANEEIKSAETLCTPLISSEVTVGATISCTNPFMKTGGLRIFGDHE